MTPAPALRADARRNHERLLAAARDLFIEQGPDVPLEDIARRAGVGIGTLYRRFPDRASLAHEVVTDALVRTAELAEGLLQQSDDSFAAIAGYVHGVLDLRTPAVIPALLAHLNLDSPEISAARERSAAAIQALITSAQADKTLRTDVTFADVGLMLIRLAQPLPGDLSAELQSELAHRHADLLLDALSPDHHGRLSGPQLERSDLNARRRQSARAQRLG